MVTTESHNPENPANSPGAILKRCREFHGITLEEAAEATKIGVSYLAALENDQISEFASLAYLKGFLRIYTAHLGLNTDDMVRLYERLYAPGKSPNNDGQDRGEAGEPGMRRRFPWQKLALPAFLLLLIIICSSIINRSPAPPRQEPPSSARTVNMAVPPVQQPHSSAVSAPAEAKIEEAAPAEKPKMKEALPENAKPHVQQPDPGKGFIVRMKVTQNGTLTVVIDGGASQDYDLAPGDVIEWKADRSVDLDLSNAGGVEVEQNGKQLKPFGPAGRSAYIVIEADGVKQ